MGVNNLAEAIILQSIEDLWSEKQRKECIDFFKGEGFCICAGIAGMNLTEQIRLLNMVNRVVKNERRKIKVGNFSTLTTV